MSIMSVSGKRLNTMENVLEMKKIRGKKKKIYQRFISVRAAGL